MDEPTLPLPGARWGHLRWLLLLVLVAAGLRAWQLARTEVATRDSIAYITYAWRLEHEAWLQVVRTSQHHPGYPVLIRLASVPVRAAVPDDLPFAMQLSAQLVSCLAGVLLVVPMYFLGGELFGRRVGFWAALLFQVLPASGRLMPDGLTEPLFLLLASTALLAGCKAVRAGHVGWYVLAGLASGFAYLTRAEGLLVGLVTGLVMLLMQGSPVWRKRWPVVLRQGVALAVAMLLVAGPFMHAIGGFTAKPSAVHMVNPSAWKMAPRQASVRSPLPLAAWNFGPDVKPEDRYGWAAGALVTMIDKGFFHVLTIPFVIGLFLFRRRPWANPALFVPLTLSAVLLPLVYRLGQSNGYLGERHVMLIVMCGLYWAVAAVAVMAGGLARLWPRVPAVAWATGLLVLASLAPLPKTLARLHSERVGFREAGEWLAKNAGPDDLLVDPFAWSSYYSGQLFTSGPKGPPDPAEWVREKQPEGSACYVILDEGRSQHEHLWYLLGPARELARRGQEVRRFKTGWGKRAGEVVIYRVRL